MNERRAGRTFYSVHAGTRRRSAETGGSEYKIDRTKACQLACQCCLDLHTHLNFFPTPIEGKYFTLHIGVGYGRVTILQVSFFSVLYLMYENGSFVLFTAMLKVGGTLDRWEYVVAGPPMQEISIAEPLAGSGETVIAPTVIEGLGGEVRRKQTHSMIEIFSKYRQRNEYTCRNVGW